ncbi:MAG: LytTR family DNA-binding domain-containing protein [Massilibacteroides sp.]|nr:LytTR family DNA-binding domain-containing protein [Massilibacteroides sp.]MDD3061730.1 LytTR family DNA-binding domain-containing protein [Massilibacteroides sp.]MDD4115160.1 LytTR family DNA-binding domain-containing protein [Massilibacteroides sp.]MDD4660613.1 LytTR family DNA-binding domain-containing protein [Massilibacteroides sp.]
MEIRCIITDDEPTARAGLLEYVGKVNFLTLVGECEDAVQLNNMLSTVQPDLLFLDIEMPYISGLQLLSSLKNPPKVIITSAYDRYAIDGYELNVIDYLLKPISFERFLKAVNKVYDLIDNESKSDPYAHIFVKTDRQLKKILLNDILFVESMENYVLIYTINSKEIVRMTLRQLFELLPHKYFLQVHRSYIVNLNHVQGIEGNILNIRSYKITIARNFRDIVFNKLLSGR